MPLRILGLADLHDHAEMLNLLSHVDADLIAFCGDLHNGSSPARAKTTTDALASLGKPVLIVPGNMDPRDVVPEIWKQAGFVMLHRASCRQGDYGFLGMGGMVARNPQRLGDPARYYHREEEVYESLAVALSQISGAKCRIVLTHQPPLGARDIIYSGESTGSVSLRRFIEEHQPQLLLCGHIHEDRGEARIGRTRIVNVGELRRGYAASIELGDKIRVEWIGQ